MTKSSFLIAVCLFAFVVLEASVFLSPAFAVNTHNACRRGPRFDADEKNGNAARKS